MDAKQIQEIFTYHSPKSEQIEKYAKIRAKALELALLLNELCPESREKSLAITHLQMVSMQANASIAIHS